MNMKYWSIRCSINSSITGVNNAIAQVETLNNKKEYSFVNTEEEKYFVDFCHNIWEKSRLIYADDFHAIDNHKISMIKYFPTRKRVKEIDILSHTTQSSFSFFDFLISDKALKIFLGFNLPPFNIIPAKVEGFTTSYYLIGFSNISNSEIDFSKSIFHDDVRNQEISFHDYNDYKNNKNICVSARKIILANKYDYDVIRTPLGLFFSESLITQIRENNVMGIDVENVSLVC